MPIEKDTKEPYLTPIFPEALHKKNKGQLSRGTVRKSSQTGDDPDMNTSMNEIENNDHKNKQAKKLSWEERYLELIEFKRIHGHCNVTQHDKYSRSLGNWVSKQRQRKKKGYKTKYSKLSPEQVSLLDEIGFEWDRSNWAQKNQKNEVGRSEKAMVHYLLNDLQLDSCLYTLSEENAVHQFIPRRLIKIYIQRNSDPKIYQCYICARTIRELKARLQICFGSATASFYSQDGNEFPSSLDEIDPTTCYCLVDS